MNILFLSSALPRDISETVKHNSEAANNFIWGIIDELKKKHSVQMLSYIGYEVDNPEDILKNMKTNDIECVIKQRYGILGSALSYYRKLYKLTKNADVVIIYNLIYINAFARLISIINNCKILIIIADHDDKKHCVRLSKKIVSHIAWSIYKKSDYRVVLSYNLYKKFPAKGSLWMPGGIDIESFKTSQPNNISGKMNITYCGLLSKVTGVDTLVEFIQKNRENSIVKDSCFTMIGKGELQPLLDRISEDNIQFKGFLAREDLVLEIEKSHVLINPRNMDYPENNNNFPSKIMEYLASGRIVVSTKFPGYELFNANIFFYESDMELLRILEYLQKNYSTIYENVFYSNRQFSRQFEWRNQVERIEQLFVE